MDDFVLNNSNAVIALRFSATPNGKWGLTVEHQGMVLRQPQPIFVERFSGENEIEQTFHTYESVEWVDNTIIAKARVSFARDDPGCICAVEDQWFIREDEVRLKRSVKVAGRRNDGFLTAICFAVNDHLKWSDVDAFAPGMIYGRIGRLNPRAIGSQENYADGVRHFIIREDRLPVPLFGLYNTDGSYVTLLNPTPDARTIAEEGLNLQPITRIDNRLRFGALGISEEADTLKIGYWFPGTEGEITYRGREFPFGQLRTWRRVYHPIEDGLEQTYEIALRLGTEPTFSDYCRATWRWAWKTLQPQVYPQNIAEVRESSTRLLYDMMHRALNGRIGIYLWADISADAKGSKHYRFEHTTTMGFTGRGPDSGYYLLREAARTDTPMELQRQFYERGRAAIDSYVSIPMNPPAAEGFNLLDGALHTHKFVEGEADTLYLRSLCEGGKFVLKAWQAEHIAGNDQPEWLKWGQQIADFFLSKQLPNGGVPRIYTAGTGEVYKESPRSSYNVISLWTLTAQITGDPRYLEAALRAGEFCWSDGHQNFNFVGGTIDNPDVIDKEAGTLSLEGYLALYEQTHDGRWLDRAKQAADYCETWIYCWNVPMPEDADDARLDWKKGVPTVGVQLIATGHSLVDDYMAFDVASYAKLFAYTQDEHYYDVALILLHNTKIMTCLQEHPYDLPRLGWQQEHWSIAPSRGIGMHRGWLAWVTCSNLQGILELEDFNHDLYQQIVASAPTSNRART